MRIQMMSLVIAAALAGCGGSKTPAPEPPDGDPKAAPSGAPKAALTQEACEAQGGEVVGDIGDGATHRPDYVCPSGRPPLGSISPPEGGPVAIEGSVCCPK